jgi:hypothetical protein
MRRSTRVLQIFSLALGGAFAWSAFGIADEFLPDGLVAARTLRRFGLVSRNERRPP